MNNAAKTQNNRDRINLRLSGETLSLVDQARLARPGSVSRNTWIAEAIQEKLSRELEQIVEPSWEKGRYARVL